MRYETRSVYPTRWWSSFWRRSRRGGAQRLRSALLRLEQLEDRLTPTGPTLSVLASFNGTSFPSSLTLDNSGNLYGTVYPADASNGGMLIELAHGSGKITTLASFNNNGDLSLSSLLRDSSGNLYGETALGGPSDAGTIFELAHGSSTITTLATFNVTNGKFPVGGLIMDSSGNLYGTTSSGGTSGDGTIFQLAHGSSTITTLASFNGINGVSPQFGLLRDSSGNLYGTTEGGGASGAGSVFELAHGSSTITTLASFSSNAFSEVPRPSGLVMDGSGNLYGTTALGGASGDGSVFELAHGSGNITTLASFNYTDGDAPHSGVIMDSSGNLFGATSGGGTGLSFPGPGTVFELAHGSGNITTLASFSVAKGVTPVAGLVMDSSGNLYGTTTGGGANNYGTIFELQGADPHTTRLTVTSAQDPTSLTPGTLRYAVNQANADAVNGISDTIVFNTAQMGTSTITLHQGQLDLSAGKATITIDGGGHITVSGNNASRVFEVETGSVTISGLTITGGSSPSGGGVLNLADLTLDQDVLTGNRETAGGNGGGAVLSWGGGTSLTVNQSTISNNSATWTGGGISLIDGGTLLLTNSTVSGNTSSRDGGGITVQSISHNVSATVENCTIANNTASQYSGGGILNIGYGKGTSATLTILDSTIAGNHAPYAGGVSSWASSGTVTTKYGNTIFAGNTNGNVPYQSGTLTSLGHNLSSDGTGNLTAAGDRPNTAALLAPLGNYGGPTQTMALLAGSPAIDVGDPKQLGVADQRGVVRTGGVNIGAYQASASALVLTAPASVTAGTPFTLTVTAVDAFGQVAVGYRGTVHFSSSDAAATLPTKYTFTAGDNGVHHFVGLVLRTKGRQTITATDVLVASILGSVTESVL
jgi:uncharacterized repeat protein (TIGR03803 family)